MTPEEALEWLKKRYPEVLHPKQESGYLAFSHRKVAEIIVEILRIYEGKD